MSEVWWPWIYQYSVGGTLFLGGLFIFISKGAIQLNRRRDRWLVLSLCLGLLSFATFHGIWIYKVLSEGAPT